MGARNQRSGTSSPAPRGTSLQKTVSGKPSSHGGPKLKVETGNEPASTKRNEPDAGGAPAEPSLPMTPKSPSPKLAPQEDTQALPDPVMAHDMQAVNELLGTMKCMLGTLGSTFDTLGDQTIKVATLPIAIEAIHQIAAVRKELDERQQRREARMDELKRTLLEEVKTKVHEDLKNAASRIVKEIVRKEVAQRVRTQLQAQITQVMRDDLVAWKQQIAEVKVRLYNS
ncbi:hypothetical protein NM688_g8270 [Phlebia brevispora]|uniref:Uncharacterized protein n=1 Tax=Phlebia brevispora TaxID=194682 RepID=A0ACC1RV57_9APHY|nr:hypothetical protein NM688_g8270 [Phlebia brevispora]